MGKVSKKNKEPLISVIVPVYNGEKYIKTTLDLLLKVDCPKEIIVINDCSKDSSAKILSEYKDSIKLFSLEKNMGVSNARNLGIANAIGEYICFVDSDDYVATTYISTLYKVLVSYKTNISSCYVKRIKINEKPIRTNNNTYTLEFKELMSRFFKYEFWGLPGKLYKKTIFKDIVFPKATLCEDYAIVIQLFHKEKIIAHTEQALYFYEYHESSLSHQHLTIRAFDEFENVKYVYDYTATHCSEFNDYAIANVIESAVKLYLLKINKGNTYNKYFRQIRYYLQSNFGAIIRCNSINIKTKGLAIGITLAPQSTIYIYNKIKCKR